MAQIALFHSVLGVRPGITDAATRLRSAGHEVVVVDQYDGRVFDDYEEAGAHFEAAGLPALLQAALDGVRDLPDGFVAAGFSNGAGMAEYVATRRRCAGVLLFSGALPLALLGDAPWPAGVPAQLHYTVGDPFRREEWVTALADEVAAAGERLELVDHEGSGHLFTDPGLAAEYDPQATERLWRAALAFCDRVAG